MRNSNNRPCGPAKPDQTDGRAAAVCHVRYPCQIRLLDLLMTWSDLGSQQMGDVKDMALGIDAQSLFLASDQGVFRLALN